MTQTDELGGQSKGQPQPDEGNTMVARATYQLFMVLVTLLALAITGIYYILPLPDTVRQVLYILDSLISFILLFDFFAHLFAARGAAALPALAGLVRFDRRAAGAAGIAPGAHPQPGGHAARAARDDAAGSAAGGAAAAGGEHTADCGAGGAAGCHRGQQLDRAGRSASRDRQYQDGRRRSLVVDRHGFHGRLRRPLTRSRRWAG
jgi:hypothetical protein